MAAEGGVFTYIFTGTSGEVIPRDATHLIMHESVTAIPVEAFRCHPNIVEVYCHAGVEKIEREAFYRCPRLRRVIILGVKVVEDDAFHGCEALTYIECPKLERIGAYAFRYCKSLRSIDLPSTKEVGIQAFLDCRAVTGVKFGSNLESIGGALYNCRSLERVTIPLKKCVAVYYAMFTGCDNFRQVDLVEGEVLQKTVNALLLEEWRNDMETEIDSINQTLPNADPGELIFDPDGDYVDIDPDGKTRLVREWIKRVLRKIIHYKAEHRLLLNEAAATLKLSLPNDNVMNNVLSFLELPLHTFDGEVEGEAESSSSVFTLLGTLLGG